MDIHAVYRASLIAALEAERISLTARLATAAKYVLNESMIMECRLLREQIKAVSERGDKLNNG